MAIPKLNPIKQQNGILQIVHDFEFMALNLGEGYTEIRDMNKDEKYEYICKRVKKLADRGYGGIVLNSDFKNYLENDEDIEFTLKIAEYAKSLGLVVWIYDEQYYPSGTAGGLTLKDHPELQTLGLARITKTAFTDGRTPIRVASPYGHSELKYAIAIPVANGISNFDNAFDISEQKDLSGGLCAYLPEGEWCVNCYFYRAIYDHSIYANALRASRRTINIFDSRTTDRFFEVTYENGYKKHLKGKLGDIADAVFTDEPSYPACAYHTSRPEKKTRFVSHPVSDEEDLDVVIYPYIIWTEDMPTQYFETYGENLIILLPHLFENTSKSNEIRTKFYTLTSKMARDGFVINYRNRLENEGLMLSGHYFLEEEPDWHPLYFGDIIDHLSNFSIPGCDKLWSDPEHLRYCAACKLASSASHLANRESTMIEASNMFDEDQNITLEKLKGAISIMFVHDVNLITSYYGEDILPPNEMADFADYVAKVSSLLKGGKYKTDTLVLYPFEQVCATTNPYTADFPAPIHTYDDSLGMNKCLRALLKTQTPFDFVNKKFLLGSAISNKELILENGQHIKHIVLPDIDNADDELARFLEKAYACGIEISSYSGKHIKGLNFTPSKLNAEEISSKEFELLSHDPYMLIMQKEFSDYDIFMIVNSSEERTSNTLKIADNDNKFAFVDLADYSLDPIEAMMTDGYANFKLEFAPLEAKFIVRYRD